MRILGRGIACLGLGLGTGAALAGAAMAQTQYMGDQNPVKLWDHLWYEILVDIWIIGIIFGIAALWMLFKFKAKSADDVGKLPRLTKAQALGWAMIPAAIFMADDFFLSAKGWTLWNIYRQVPEDALEIRVTGNQWYWEFDYGNGVETEDFNVPAGQPVVLRMTSNDVLHSFFMPKFRVKEDVMPGRITYIWFMPEEEGEGGVVTCTEYCGTAHAEMYTDVNVMSREDWDAWFEEAKKEAAEG